MIFIYRGFGKLAIGLPAMAIVLVSAPYAVYALLGAGVINVLLGRRSGTDWQDQDHFCFIPLWIYGALTVLISLPLIVGQWGYLPQGFLPESVESKFFDQTKGPTRLKVKITFKYKGKKYTKKDLWFYGIKRDTYLFKDLNGQKILLKKSQIHKRYHNLLKQKEMKLNS